MVENNLTIPPPMTLADTLFYFGVVSINNCVCMYLFLTMGWTVYVHDDKISGGAGIVCYIAWLT